MKRKADQTEDQPRKQIKIEDESKMNLSDLLPDEVIREVLSYLDDHNRRWTRLVDSRLFNLIDIRHFNIGLILDSEMSEVTRVFGRYDKPIGLTFRKPLTKQSFYLFSINSVAQLTQLTQLVSLDIGSHVPINIDQKLTNLHSLTAQVPLSDLQHHTRLTSLVTDKAHAESGQVFPSQLQRLKVGAIVMINQLTQYWGKYTYNLARKTDLEVDPERYKKCFTGMPNIKHLELNDPSEYRGIGCHLTGLESLSTDVPVMDLPARTMTGLTVLIDWHSDEIKWCFTHLTNLRQLFLNRKVHLDYNGLLPFKLLESLTVQTLPIDGYLKHLIGTQITQLDFAFRSLHVLDYVTSCGNLQRLCLTAGSEGVLNLAHLSHLTHLTSLNVLGTRSGVALKEITNIGACTNLTKLMELNLEMKEVDFNKLIDLRNLTRLTHLAFKWATPSVDLSDMTHLSSIEFHTAPVPVGLSSLIYLTRLNGPITLEAIYSLTSLQDLTVGTLVSDEELMSLSNLTQLTSLNAFPNGSGKHLTRLTRLQKLELMVSNRTKEVHDNLKAKLIYCGQLKYDHYQYIIEDDDLYN